MVLFPFRLAGPCLLRPAAERCSASPLSLRGFPVSLWDLRVAAPPAVSCYSLCAVRAFSPLLFSLSSAASAGGCQPLPSSRQAQRGLVEIKFRKASGKDTSKIPFKVLRTPSGNLPVYSRIRKHGTAVTTIIRHAMGDISALKKDLLAICEAPVRERCGTLEVKGLHVLKIKQWLTTLGF